MVKHFFCMKHEENVQFLPSLHHGILSELVSAHKLCELASIDRHLRLLGGPRVCEWPRKRFVSSLFPQDFSQNDHADVRSKCWRSLEFSAINRYFWWRPRGLGGCGEPASGGGLFWQLVWSGHHHIGEPASLCCQLQEAFFE